ncbi:putative membrane protein DUF2157 [Plasticicumulans lactativorans]|uniref:Putative membrane protein DUF2157 n=1 Tax=Plasticicumulans lactativorans TaxID=1133106 RepID=A0A4R2KQU5_9GAMM|nr:DUF2157 domain-containing protein [Plasticicumulans lactativorans]TCO76004.1 putative membrane protein DUF2157 [Plasticicumulans lactativorans]
MRASIPPSALYALAAAGHLSPAALARALALLDVPPGTAAWRRFLDRLLGLLGALLLVAAAVFFIAANWSGLSRFAQFALLQAALLGAVLFAARRGLDGWGGRGALLAAALLLGPLLALLGQTYQTGADPWELFASWAALITPWALAGCFAPLWLVWLALLDLAVLLYFGEARGLPPEFLFLGHPNGGLVALHAAVLVGWEYAAVRGVGWLAGRYGPRLIATLLLADLTLLALWRVLDFGRAGGDWALPVWALALAALYGAYRHWRRDLYLLALGCAAGIVVITAALGRQLFTHHLDAGGLLLLGLVVIGLSAGAGAWLRALARETPHDAD